MTSGGVTAVMPRATANANPSFDAGAKRNVCFAATPHIFEFSFGVLATSRSGVGVMQSSLRGK